MTECKREKIERVREINRAGIMRERYIKEMERKKGARKREKTGFMREKSV